MRVGFCLHGLGAGYLSLSLSVSTRLDVCGDCHDILSSFRLSFPFLFFLILSFSIFFSKGLYCRGRAILFSSSTRNASFG